MKNAIGYIRVSTEEQANDDRYGIEIQKQAITEYANTNGYTITQWLIDTMTGTSDERPEWNRILSEDDGIMNPPYEAVIAFKSDRIAREMKLYFYYLYILEKRNIKMISTKEDFGESGDFANIYRALMLFVAEQERKNIALRTGTGRKIKAAAGGYSGGRCPYGYEVDNGNLIINLKEAEMVRKIFELKNKYSLQQIADILNEEGYQTKKGGIFYPSTLKAILDNKNLYLGKYRYGKDSPWVQGVHEPILKENDDD